MFIERNTDAITGICAMTGRALDADGAVRARAGQSRKGS